MLKIISIVLLLSGCSAHLPINVSNICDLLDDEVSWYSAVSVSEKRWGVPKWLILAFINQESHFASDATPPRDKIFGIPLFSSSTAYGFGQVKDTTWQWYKSKNNISYAKRNDFADVTYFIGWFVSWHSKELGISKNDVYNQYLAYHEGHRGYKDKSYKDKGWLIKVAKSVAMTANKYKKQLVACEDELSNNTSWSFF